MLNYLAIRNFAIVDDLSVELEKGFIVLTGETGAGKSIIVQSVHLLLGGRASVDMVRTNSETAEVEGEFTIAPDSSQADRLRELELAEGDTLRVRRVISRSGRNRVFINERSASLNTLIEITRGLIDISGQHEHVQLTDEETHRDILDDFGRLGDERGKVRVAVEHLRALESEAAELRRRDAQRAEREEYLRFQIDRIKSLDPAPGEVELLEQERSRLRNHEKLQEGLQAAAQELYEREGCVVDSLGQATSRLGGLVQYDEALHGYHQALEAVLRQAEDLGRELVEAAGAMEADPERLDEIEQRLSALKELMRVHGLDLEALVEKLSSMERELAALDDLSVRIREVDKKMTAAREKAMALAVTLSGKRRKVAKELGARLVKELRSLAMQGARVEIAVIAGESLQDWGLDSVRFLLSANPGEELRPLAKVASGGELSRVLLALKAVLSEVDRVPAYIFDEVDSGVGGAVAGVIGAKLGLVSRAHQVVCITHLAQIAAFAGKHYLVSKRVVGERTVSEISLLDDKKRVEEIARMVGGTDVTEKARTHARDLLRTAKAKPGL